MRVSHTQVSIPVAASRPVGAAPIVLGPLFFYGTGFSTGEPTLQGTVAGLDQNANIIWQTAFPDVTGLEGGEAVVTLIAASPLANGR